MKKINYIISVVLSALLGFLSCQTDEISEQSTGMLGFEVSVDTNPEVIVTRSGIDVDDLEVQITAIDDNGNEIEDGYKELFPSYRELKDAGLLELETGRYRVEAYSSIEVNTPVSEYPTYYGSSNTRISGGLVNIVEVRCEMQEVQIQLDLSGIKDLLDELNAAIYSKSEDESEYELIHSFAINDETGKTDAPYFKPDHNLKVVIEGKYGGLDLGTLGEHLVTDWIRPAEIKANTSLILIALLAEPEATQPIRFNLQTLVQ